MKGVSPLIAAVILIAFVIAVSGIASTFFSEYGLKNECLERGCFWLSDSTCGCGLEAAKQSCDKEPYMIYGRPTCSYTTAWVEKFDDDMEIIWVDDNLYIAELYTKGKMIDNEFKQDGVSCTYCEGGYSCRDSLSCYVPEKNIGCKLSNLLCEERALFTSYETNEYGHRYPVDITAAYCNGTITCIS